MSEIDARAVLYGITQNYKNKFQLSSTIDTFVRGYLEDNSALELQVEGEGDTLLEAATKQRHEDRD
jgi:hypothetical protein